jgi:hypothetical protein
MKEVELVLTTQDLARIGESDAFKEFDHTAEEAIGRIIDPEQRALIAVMVAHDKKDAESVKACLLNLPETLMRACVGGNTNGLIAVMKDTEKKSFKADVLRDLVSAEISLRFNLELRGGIDIRKGWLVVRPKKRPQVGLHAAYREALAAMDKERPARFSSFA